MIKTLTCEMCGLSVELDTEQIYLVEPIVEVMPPGDWLCSFCVERLLDESTQKESTESMIEELARFLVEHYESSERFHWIAYLFECMSREAKEHDEPEPW